MANQSKGRAVIKFAFWTALAISLFVFVGYLHKSHKFEAWYYYKAAMDGYAINADTFKDASSENPAILEIGDFDKLDGAEAMLVKKGDKLPAMANGVISEKILKEAKRAALETAPDGAQKIKIMIPWEIQQSKGFKFKDTFKHKGIETYPWGAVYNVMLIIGLGVALGYMAEGFTDVIGIKLEKIRHFEGH